MQGLPSQENDTDEKKLILDGSHNIGLNGKISGTFSSTNVVEIGNSSTPAPNKNNKLLNNNQSTPQGQMTSKENGVGKGRLITASSQNKGSSQVR